MEENAIIKSFLDNPDDREEFIKHLESAYGLCRLKSAVEGSVCRFKAVDEGG